MIQKKWFRIETGADGSVLSCVEVPAQGRNGAVVRFYEAADKAAACSAAKEWYEKHRQSMNASSKRTKERAAVAEKCRICLREPPRPGRLSCQGCVDSLPSRLPRKAHKRENRGNPEKVRDSFRDTLQRTTEMHKEVFGSPSGYNFWLLLRKFDTLGPAAFRDYLVSKIPNYEQLMAKQAAEQKKNQPITNLNTETDAAWVELEEQAAAE